MGVLHAHRQRAGIFALDTSARATTDLIGHIYDAVIEPDRWSDAIDRIRRHLELSNAMIGVNALPSGQSIIEASSNVPERFVKLAPNYGREILDLWGGAAVVSRVPIEEPAVLTRFTGVSHWTGNRYYDEWAVPQGLVDQMVIIVERSPSMIATLGMGLQKSMPPISDAQIEAARVLAPHLRRAVIISGLLEKQAQTAASFEAALSVLGSAVVLVDRLMGIVYANAKAERLLHDSDPIALMGGKLHVPGQVAGGQLEATVDAAAGDGAKLGQAGNGIAVRRRDGSSAVLHVLPLRPQGARTSWQAVAAVFVAEPDAPLNLPAEAIKLLYGLRPAEVRVLELLVSGLSERSIAEALGVAPSTVKTHTLRLFDKLGKHTRAGVVELARAMSLGTL